MTTKAQEWARRRNLTKGRLNMAKAFCLEPVHVTTKIERQLLDGVILKIDKVLRDWDENNEVSKGNYLKGEGE